MALFRQLRDITRRLNFQSLFDRLDENTKEIIIATNSTMEGDTTALYICKMLKSNENLIVTRLASGLPTGSNLDYADKLTLMHAFKEESNNKR